MHAVVEAAVEEYKIHRLLGSVCISCRSSTTRISRGSAKGSGRQLATAPCITTFACTSLHLCRHPHHRSRRASSNKRPIRRWSMLCRNVWLARCPGRLLLSSRGIQQPTRPSHHTTQSNKPPTLAAVYIYSRRGASSGIRTETRLGKRASYDMHLSPAPQLTHAVAPAGEYVPAQHRHASVHRHEPLRVAVYICRYMTLTTMKRVYTYII